MLTHMRTSFDLPDVLYRRLKERAAEEGVAMRDVMLRAIQAYLGGGKPTPYVFRWRVTKGGRQLVPDEILGSRTKLNEYLARDDPDDRG